MRKKICRLVLLLAGALLLAACERKDVGNLTEAESGEMVVSSNVFVLQDEEIEPTIYTLQDEVYEEKTIQTPEILTGYFAPTNLPVLYLTTEGGVKISSNKEYVSGNAIIDGKELTCQFRGRGNASWTTYPQKSYLVKFEEKVSFFGMKPSKKWVLRSNYGDDLIMRDAIAADLSRNLPNLEFTAETCSVDVILNRNYVGVYQLAEKVSLGKDKVNIFSKEEEYPFEKEKAITYGQLCKGETLEFTGEDISFFMETSFDYYNSHVYGLEYFKVGHCPSVFLSYPEPVSENQDAINQVINYITEVDAAIVKGESIEEYIDMDSFVDWFLVMEITFNTDSSFNRSTYLYKRPGGKLMIGPVWDFDHALGNFKFDEPTYQSYCTGEAIYAMCQNHWPDYLVKNDTFMEAVAKRFDEKKDMLLQVIEEQVPIHMDHVALSKALQERCYYSPQNYDVSYPLTFLENRMDWLDQSLHSGNYNRHPATTSINWEPPESEEIDDISETEEEMIEPMTDFVDESL